MNLVGISVVQSEIARQRHIMPTKLFHVSQFLCQSKGWLFSGKLEVFLFLAMSEMSRLEKHEINSRYIYFSYPIFKCDELAIALLEI